MLWSGCWAVGCAYFVKIHWVVYSDLCTFLCLHYASIKGLLNKWACSAESKKHVVQFSAYHKGPESLQHEADRQMHVQIMSSDTHNNRIVYHMQNHHWGEHGQLSQPLLVSMLCAPCGSCRGPIFLIPSHTWLSHSMAGTLLTSVHSPYQHHCLHFGQPSLIQHWPLFLPFFKSLGITQICQVIIFVLGPPDS